MQIKHILFDLDNTIYPSSSKMNDGITKRMLECVADFFNVSYEEAIEYRKKNITNYSTTLEWLRDEGLTDIERFLAYVHPENEADELNEQPKLREYLLSIKYPKSILTNAPKEHADRVLSKLGIADLFETITDIRDANFFGKPYPQSYEAALTKMNAQIETTLFLDDMRKYVDGWKNLGGTAILIGKDNGRPLSPNANSVQITKKSEQGRIINLNSIYELQIKDGILQNK